MEEKLYFAHVVDDMVVEVKETTQEWVNEQEDSEAWIQTFPNVYGGVHYIETEVNGMKHLKPNEEQDSIIIKRKNSAKILYHYDKEKDAFIPLKLFQNFVLDENKCTWNPPVDPPNFNSEEGYVWLWNDKHKKWVEGKKQGTEYVGE